jgi:two-component system, OmpR family, osmolarity sensor histidine kinase EnvZ
MLLRDGDPVLANSIRELFRLRRFGIAHRTMLLLVAAVTGSIVVLGLGFAMQRRADYAEFTDARARAIAAQVHSTRLVLLSVPREYRSSVSDGLRSSGTVNAFPAESVVPPDRVPVVGGARSRGEPRLLGGDPAESMDVSEAIERYTLPPTEVRFTTTPGPRYWINQNIDGESWWIVVLAGIPPPPPAGMPWLFVAAVLLGLLAVAALYASTITRPLRSLAQVTRRIGDTWPESVVVNGPVELRELASSFNEMLVRLRQIEDERLVLLGGLPHDLRSPLTRLRLRLATLTDLGEHPAIADDIAAIDRIVRQFSEYLRGVPSDESRLPLQDILDSAVESCRNLGRNVRLDSDAPVTIAVPQFAVRRLIDNLIDNALQHGREPVRVRARYVDTGRLEIEVLDQGAGISPEAAEAALRPFTKLDPARASGGCGLGLAIVRQLARQLGGSVRFERTVEGFAVVVTLGVQCEPSSR